MAIWLRMLIGGGIGLAGGGLLGYFGKCGTGACPLTANPYRGALFGALIGVAIALAVGSGLYGARSSAGAVRHINSQDEFTDLVLKADKPVLVDFYWEPCPPCIALAPTIEKLSEEYKGRAEVVKVERDKVPGLLGKYNIEGFPTVLLFKGGKEIGRWPGFDSEEANAATYRAALNAAIK
ncbi:MAG TPA: DUF6132 family protein [Phycisphaerae bacterium]|nr:DUF6132 family protein [Phycisphaerae bacterium]